MKRGFTLLELIIVIIIIGVLATLGLTQYASVIEKSRGAEARAVISTLRSSCAGIWMQDGNTNSCTAGNLGMSTAAAREEGRLPGTSCWTTNYFRYGINVAGTGNTITFRATRCTTGGKSPNLNVTTAPTLDLAIDYSAGSDVWSSTGGY